jgi:protein-disulfide isomerase
MSAAIASLCAGEQDVYWPYHDKLFENQEQLGKGLYIQLADELGLDLASFQTCLDSGKFDDFIQEDLDFALNLGIRSTPTFFINGLAVVGAQPIDVFTQVIDQELAGEIPE